MIGAYVIAAIALVLLGAAGGFIIVVSLGSHRDKDLITPPSGRIKRGARVANGLHVLCPGDVHREAACRHDHSRPADWDWRER